MQLSHRFTELMNRKRLACQALLACAVFTVSAGAAAADQFWVSLGSYSKLQSAETMRDRAAASFYELSIVPSDSPMGFVYRVLDGPVDSRASAQSRLDQARAAGFIDAWLFIHDSNVPMAAAEAPSYTAPAGETYTGDYRLSDSASGDVLDAYSNTDSGSAPSSADYNAVSIGTEELVETAPAGYGLHQLERSMMNAPPGAAAESRLRELRESSSSDSSN